MIFKYILPNPLLQDFVRDYLVAHFVFDKNETIPFKPFVPRPEQGIAFFPKGYVSIYDPDNENFLKAPHVSIFGQVISRHNYHITQEYLMFSIQFHPGALYRFLGVPLSEFTDQYSDAALVINREIQEVNERLANCDSYGRMVAVVESYLIEKTKKVKVGIEAIDKVALCINANPTQFSLDYLSSQACLCPRQFNRKFTERIGIGPKLYSRIVRFYNAYQFKERYPSEDWLSVALLFGYYDYQHMVRDFKYFANVTPSKWISEDNQSPERILQLE